MAVVMFTKSLKDRTVPQLIDLAHELGLEGYDLCVRPEYPINPDNAAIGLVGAVRALGRAGLSVPMVTGNFDLLFPDDETAEPILGAMDAANVRLLKLGYFKFDPGSQDYWSEVDRIRTAFDGWSRLAEKYGVKVCYHTHSRGCMGLNAGMMAHLVRGFDPRLIGVYLDPCHLVVEGEEFPTATAIVGEHLSILALKDALLERGERNGHGSLQVRWVEAGRRHGRLDGGIRRTRPPRLRRPVVRPLRVRDPGGRVHGRPRTGGGVLPSGPRRAAAKLGVTGGLSVSAW